MPLYDFKCTACGKVDERFVTHSTTSTMCLDCAMPTARLQPSQFAFSLKGDGAYKPGLSPPNRKPA